MTAAAESRRSKGRLKEAVTVVPLLFLVAPQGLLMNCNRVLEAHAADLPWRREPELSRSWRRARLADGAPRRLIHHHSGGQGRPMRGRL